MSGHAPPGKDIVTVEFLPAFIARTITLDDINRISYFIYL